MTDVAVHAPSAVRTVKHALVLAKRNLVKTTRTPEQLVDVTLQPILFLLLFVYVFGGAIAGGSQHEYLEFLLPGLLGQTIAMGSIALGQNLNADIQKGVFDRFRSLPIARSAPLVGAVLADFFRYLTICVIVIGFGYVMGFRIATNPLALLASIGLALCFALAFAWISVWVGMMVRTPGSVQGIMFLLIFPLSFGSNTFVKTSTMPGWLQAFVNVNPMRTWSARCAASWSAARSPATWAGRWHGSPDCCWCSSRWRCGRTDAVPDVRAVGSLDGQGRTETDGDGHDERMRSDIITIRTGGRPVVHDLTRDCEQFVAGGEGLLNVFVPHATAGVAILETGAGSDDDLLTAIDELLPRDGRWSHQHGSPGHGRDHVLPAFIAPSIVVPVLGGRLQLGTWQSICLVDTNVDNAEREVRLSLLE